jgi:hypothetical protein
MSHVVIIIQQTVLPPPDTSATAADAGVMTAEVKYTPADTATPTQIGNQVERIVKRLAKLADD